MRRARTVLAGVLATGGFYLLLIDTAYQPELDVGVGVVALAAVAYAAELHEDGDLLADPVAWLRGGARAIARIPGDIVILAGVALLAAVRPGSGPRGEFVRRSVSGERNADRARREILGSLAPGEIVIGHEQDDGQMLVHRLRGGR